MRASRPVGAAVLSSQCLLLALAGCGGVTQRTSEPVPTAVSAESTPEPALVKHRPPSTLSTVDSAFEQRRLKEAEELTQANRWAEAAAQWEILTLLRPERSEYASKLTEAQSRASSNASENLTAAAEARKRGDLQRATLLYLKALRADPYNAAADQALRDLERQQSHRLYFNHLASTASGARATRTAAAPYSTDHQELDTGVMLLHQGDYNGSVQALQSYVKREPQDETGKRALRDAYAALGRQRIEQGKKEEGIGYLEKARATKAAGSANLDSTLQAVRKDMAQDYYEQGLRMQRTDLQAAIGLWERSLEYDPGHAQARLRLDQAKRMQRNLQTIPGARSTP
jgi:tetratricopeptide (TPR) repeat protein